MKEAAAGVQHVAQMLRTYSGQMFSSVFKCRLIRVGELLPIHRGLPIRLHVAAVLQTQFVNGGIALTNANLTSEDTRASPLGSKVGLVFGKWSFC